MAIVFDPANKRIILDTDSVTVVELYSRSVDWLTQSDNLKYGQIFRQVGGDAISPTQNLGSTFFILNGWKIRPMEAPHTLVVDGNLYTDPAGFSPFTSTLGGFNVNIESKVSNLVDSAVAQLTELEQLSFEGVVRVDQVNGVTGTAYPIGSRSTPCRTFADAVIIAEARKIPAIRVIGYYTTSIGEVVTNKTIEGSNLNSDRLITVTGSAFVGCNFKALWVSGNGVIGGTYQECFVENIPTLLGGAKDTGFLGTVSFYPAAPNAFQMFDCHATSSTLPQVVLNCNPAVNIMMHRCSGKWILRNVTGGLHVLNMVSGAIELDNTCTGGSVVIRGDASVVNNSNGCSVDVSGVIGSQVVTKLDAACIPVNIKKVNSQTIYGNGSDATPWGAQP